MNNEGADIDKDASSELSAQRAVKISAPSVNTITNIKNTVKKISYMGQVRYFL